MSKFRSAKLLCVVKLLMAMVFGIAFLEYVLIGSSLPAPTDKGSANSIPDVVNLNNTSLSRPMQSTLAACSSNNLEQYPMREYASVARFDSTTTIILNVFRGSTDAFRIQLETAMQTIGGRAMVPHIWVNMFALPHEDEFENVFKTVERNLRRGKYGDHNQLPELALTKSSFNYKFHGRFLLGFMAPTRYLLVIDDDAEIGTDAVRNLVHLMETKHRGVWGGFGHLRGDGVPNDRYRSWPNVNIDRDKFDHYEMDYLSGMWFLEQSWLEFMWKERPLTWETGEDIHLSHAVRKYLGLNTYGGVVSMNAPKLPGKLHSATVGHFLEMREHMFDHYLGRGNKIADVRPTIDTLVYVETAEQIKQLMNLVKECLSFGIGPIWCNLGKIAAVFRGFCHDQDVNGLIESAKKLCSYTHCESFALKSSLKHPIMYFNMRQSFGLESEVVPIHTSMVNVLPSLAGILNNVEPKTFLYVAPECDSGDVGGTLHTAMVKLAFDSYLQSKLNAKFSEEQHKIGHGTHAGAPRRPRTKGFLWKGRSFEAHSLQLGNCLSVSK